MGSRNPEIYGTNHSLAAQPLEGVIPRGGRVGQFRTHMEEAQQQQGVSPKYLGQKCALPVGHSPSERIPNEASTEAVSLSS